MDDCRAVKVPMLPETMLYPTKNKKSLDHPYREIVGSLMYIMLATRPDLCFPISYLSRFQDKWDETHWNILKYLLRYLKGSKDVSLIYNRKQTVKELLGFVDADHARDRVDRKSTTGFLFEVYGNSVVWCSRKQTGVSLSSTEAEYIASSLAVCEAMWLRGLLNDLNVEVPLPINLMEDSQSCIKLAHNQETKRCKHIDIRHHHVKDNIDKGVVDLVFVSSKDQKAALMTKPLPSVQFAKLCEAIGLGKAPRGGIEY